MQTGQGSGVMVSYNLEVMLRRLNCLITDEQIRLNPEQRKTSASVSANLPGASQIFHLCVAMTVKYKDPHLQACVRACAHTHTHTHTNAHTHTHTRTHTYTYIHTHTHTA